ncbi:MAG: alpha/beta fold hydrolase [Elusimicrobia bacterium]|nr:alpha/beta fold hydrolase [Elusimicrobiota bacterium]
MIPAILFILTVLIILIGYYGLPEKRLPLPKLNKSQIINGAEPVFLKGSSDEAVLLVHGLRSTPQSMKYLGEKLHAKGYTVIIPLLPGHGTNYEDFAKTRFYHWYNAVYKEAVGYRGKYKKFYICGLSMGGAVTLKLLEELQPELLPDAAVLISTPVFFNKISPEVINIHDIRLFLLGIIKIFVKKITDPPPSKQELEIIPEIIYEGFHIPVCVHSLQKAIRGIDRNLSKVKTPVLLLQAKGDKTVPDKNIDYIYNHISSSDKEKYLFDLTDDRITKRHAITLNRYIKNEVAEKTIDFFKKK